MLTDLLAELVDNPRHGAVTIFMLWRKSFHEFFRGKFGFSISFVVIRDGVLGHSDLISGERYLTIKYTFAHNEMLTVRNLLVIIYSFVSTPNWEMFAVQVFRSYVNYRSFFSTALISKGGKHIKASISRMWRILSRMLLIDEHVNEWSAKCRSPCYLS